MAWEYIRTISLIQYEVAQKYYVIQGGMEKGTIAIMRWKHVQILARVTEHSNRVRMIKRKESIAAMPC